MVAPITLDGGTHGIIFLITQIVGDDDIAGMQGWAKALAHIDEERVLIHWSVENHRCHDGSDTESGDEGGGVPMTAGSRRMTLLPLRRAPTRTSHGCRPTGFIDTVPLTISWTRL